MLLTSGRTWYNYFITYITVDLAHQGIFRAKVGKSSIKYDQIYIAVTLKLPPHN